MKVLDQDDAVILNLGRHGYIQGVRVQEETSSTRRSDNATANVALAHYFGGVRYALPPSQRWAMAQPLPSDYSYGTEANPGKCTGRAVASPQPFAGDEGFSEDCFQCNVWTPVGECPAGGM